jgi:hypothetical protein
MRFLPVLLFLAAILPLRAGDAMVTDSNRSREIIERYENWSEVEGGLSMAFQRLPERQGETTFTVMVALRNDNEKMVRLVRRGLACRGFRFIKTGGCSGLASEPYPQDPKVEILNTFLAPGTAEEFTVRIPTSYVAEKSSEGFALGIEVFLDDHADPIVASTLPMTRPRDLLPRETGGHREPLISYTTDGQFQVIIHPDRETLTLVNLSERKTEWSGKPFRKKKNYNLLEERCYSAPPHITKAGKMPGTRIYLNTATSTFGAYDYATDTFHFEGSD